jgi:hypothetical protein
MRHRLRTLALCSVALTGPVACNGDAQRDDAGQVQVQSDVDVRQVRTGDCIAKTAQGAVTDVTAVPCGEPHGGEAHFAFDLPAGPFPGDEPVASAAEQGCVAAFVDFVGTRYEDSELEISQLTPSAESWESGDREVLCFVRDPAGPTTGTLRGEKR